MNIFNNFLRPILIKGRIFSALIPLIWFCLLLLPACKEKNLRGVLEHDNVPPGVVDNIQVEPLHGGAKISYSLPLDLDILYVEADYEIRPGVEQEAKSSFYNDYLIVEGFGDTTEKNIDLYVVDRSGNKSKPVTITLKPLMSPVQDTHASLSYEADFGGLHATFKNEARADIAISVLIKDSLGEWTDYDRYYTGLPEGDFSVRGLPSVSTTFGLVVSDRWHNYSDTIVQTLTPLYEVQLEKTKFRPVTLPTDTKNTWNPAALWDNNTTSFSGFHSEEKAGFPVWFTFDLGIKGKLSRFKTWQVHDGREYSSGNIRSFELWGSNDPATDGSFDGWTLLGTYEVKQPSGRGPGNLSNEDIETAAAGDEFSVSSDAPAVKYLRFKILSSFSQQPNSETGSAWLLEFTFWGQEVQ